jgi:hypothetical protein
VISPAVGWLVLFPTDRISLHTLPMTEKITKKHCTACKTTKLTSEFYKKADTPDGLQTKCRVCQRKLNAKRPGLLSKPKDERCERYQIVRNTSRRSGECSWGILDSHQHGNANPVVFIGDTLKETLLECNRLNAPPDKLRYTKRGQVGFVSNDDEEVE